jgi:hypothetical protein
MTGYRCAVLPSPSQVVAHALAVVRRPMGPRDVVRRAKLFRRAAETPVGVEFLDTASVDDAVVRESQRWLASNVLAVRLPGPIDLIFSEPCLAGRESVTTTYASDVGAVVLAARYLSEVNVELSFSVDGNAWVPFADLVLSGRVTEDLDADFDAALHAPPGLRGRSRRPAGRNR